MRHSDELQSVVVWIHLVAQRTDQAHVDLKRRCRSHNLHLLGVTQHPHYWLVMLKARLIRKGISSAFTSLTHRSAEIGFVLAVLRRARMLAFTERSIRGRYQRRLISVLATA